MHIPCMPVVVIELTRSSVHRSTQATRISLATAFPTGEIVIATMETTTQDVIGTVATAVQQPIKEDMFVRPSARRWVANDGVLASSVRMCVFGVANVDDMHYACAVCVQRPSKHVFRFLLRFPHNLLNLAHSAPACFIRPLCSLGLSLAHAG